ncbi:unnamed protein product, partial [Tetraodon nigroviridis]
SVLHWGWSPTKLSPISFQPHLYLSTDILLREHASTCRYTTYFNLEYYGDCFF